MVIFVSNKKAAVKVFKKYAKKNIVKVIHEHEDGSVLFNII